MKISVFSNRKNIDKFFIKIIKAKNYQITFYPPEDFSAMLKRPDEIGLLYLDISSVKEPERKKILNLIYKLKISRTGIIDPENYITDIADLFYHGIVDYIGKNLFKTCMSVKRLESVLNYRIGDFIIPQTETKNNLPESSNFISSGDDWNLIIPGKEYTFCFMFIELDNFKDMKKTAGAERTKKIMDAFHTFISSYISSINGRIWMWMDYCGLILIPFDGSRCDAILYSFKLMLNRELINAIELKMDYSYSYNIALHVGNTIYQERGETGTIVSDSINSIFHLGQKYAEDQNFYLTDCMDRFIPTGLRDFFVPAGEFEGRRILRMKRLL